ncbi:DEAD-box ATP-dependent RNA helicase 1 [Citrus sinensis]|nr:DEAD-box ATP-dependent RNA helicase 1 [Citrus sinensis]
MEEAKKKSVPILPWMRSPVDVSLFEDCPLDHLPCLDPRLKVALQNMGISSLFPVQVAVWQETIGPGLFERDLCTNSPTGSRKSLSYALPIVQALSNRAVRCLRALVVLPTRDLALQVKDGFAAIAPAVGLSVGLAVGQSSIADEISELIKRPKLEAEICYDPEDLLQELQNAVDILVATPGRLMDHTNATRGFTLEHLCYLVVDETDRLLREAYQAWLPTVLQLTRADNENRFSFASTFLGPVLGALQTPPFPLFQPWGNMAQELYSKPPSTIQLQKNRKNYLAADRNTPRARELMAPTSPIQKFSDNVSAFHEQAV